jgi:hypothetical protein
MANPANMTPDELDRHIVISRRTAVGWRELLSALQPERTLRMVSDEMEILDGLFIACPARADELVALMDQWQDLAEQLKAKAN